MALLVLPDAEESIPAKWIKITNKRKLERENKAPHILCIKKKKKKKGGKKSVSWQETITI